VLLSELSLLEWYKFLPGQVQSVTDLDICSSLSHVDGWAKYTSEFVVGSADFGTQIGFSIGYTVSCRFSWGMRAGYFPVVIRAFVGIFFFGIQGSSLAALPKLLVLIIIQAYWGGQAVRVV
jgi:hypothetical protein